MKSHVIFGHEKNLIISPDFITLRKNDDKDIKIYNEVEISPKSDAKKRLKLTKYLNYKKETKDEFILRFIFSNPMREIAYWNWCKTCQQNLEKTLWKEAKQEKITFKKYDKKSTGRRWQN